MGGSVIGNRIVFLACAVSLIFLFNCSDNPTDPGIPHLIVPDTSFNVSGAVGTSGPPLQLIPVTSSNGDAIAFEAYIKSTNARTNNWMSLFNEVGKTPDTILVRFSIGGVEDGSHVDTIVIASSSGGESKFIQVTMNLKAVFSISLTEFSIMHLSSDPNLDTQVVQLRSNGVNDFNFTAKSSQSWLTVSSPQGVGPTALTLRVDATGLAQGVDTGIVVITCDGLLNSPQVITVEFITSAWVPQKGELAQDLASVFFLDENNGWAVGRLGNVADVTGYVLQTNDGGGTWDFSTLAPDQPLGSVEFVDNSVGWIVGGNGLVLKTTDGGSSWQTQNTPAADDSLDLWNADFLDVNLGWAVGAHGTIIATTNGGADWGNQVSGTQHALASVSFVDSQHGWIVGNGGVILRSIDGGQHWESQNSGGLVDLNGVQFLDQNEGWAVGKSGRILHTTNGGDDWNLVPSPSTEILQTVLFISLQRGWIIGNDGTILFTDDGGGLWSQQNSRTGFWLRDIFFVNESKGWVVGEKGVILHTISGGN